MIAPPVIATLLAACVAIEPSPRFDRDVALLGRSDRFDAAESFPASALVTVVAKLGSSPRAAANSFSVSMAPGAASISVPMAAATKAVVAICVVFVPAVAVGAVGDPVSAGDARGAFASSAVWSPVTCAIEWLWPYYTTLLILAGISSQGETAAVGSDLRSLRI